MAEQDFFAHYGFDAQQDIDLDALLKRILADDESLSHVLIALYLNLSASLADIVEVQHVWHRKMSTMLHK